MFYQAGVQDTLVKLGFFPTKLVSSVGRGLKGGIVNAGEFLVHPVEAASRGWHNISGVVRAERELAREASKNVNKAMVERAVTEGAKAPRNAKAMRQYVNEAGLRKEYVDALSAERSKLRAAAEEAKPWLFDKNRRVDTFREAIRKGSPIDYASQQGWTGRGKYTRYLPVGEKGLTVGIGGGLAYGALKGPSEEDRRLAELRGEELPGFAERAGSALGSSLALASVPAHAGLARELTHMVAVDEALRRTGGNAGENIDELLL